jgi:hypothetical protein
VNPVVNRGRRAFEPFCSCVRIPCTRLE